MATGDSNDIVKRIKRLIPNRWFAWVAPVRDAILGGVSDSMSWGYGLIIYAKLQTRLATATGPWLDIFSYDFLGSYLQRKGLGDGLFRTVIRSTILQERVTRAGMANALSILTGSAPIIFEPWNTGDTGGYGQGTFAYGKSGGWGSIQLPGQCFIKVRRNVGSGVPRAGGYGSSVGGYGKGSTEYDGPSIDQIGVTDDLIYATIEATKPTGVTCWTQID